MVQILGPGLKVGAKPLGVAQGDVGAWNLLMHKTFAGLNGLMATSPASERTTSVA